MACIYSEQDGSKSCFVGETEKSYDSNCEYREENSWPITRYRAHCSLLCLWLHESFQCYVFQISVSRSPPAICDPACWYLPACTTIYKFYSRVLLKGKNIFWEMCHTIVMLHILYNYLELELSYTLSLYSIRYHSFIRNLNSKLIYWINCRNCGHFICASKQMKTFKSTVKIWYKIF